MTRCTFEKCSKTHFSKPSKQIEHFREYHDHFERLYLALNGMMFRFTRHPDLENRFICMCGRTFSGLRSIKGHVDGASKREGCTIISQRAVELAQKEEECFNEKVFIHFVPLSKSELFKIK
jgi:hypothetical protein